MSFGALARALAAIALLSGMDAVIKALAARYPVFQVAFLRFAFGLVFASAALGTIRPGLPSRELVIANAGRAFLVVVTATTFFFALGELPLAETLVLSFLSPTFVALFGVFFLEERADRRVYAALLAGFAGVVVVLSDRFGVADRIPSLAGVAAALAAAVFYALSLVLLRSRAQRDPIVYIVFIQNLGPALILSPLAAAFWRAPDWSDLALFALSAALGVSGHFLLAGAYARAEAAPLASLDYTSLIWAALLGYFVFSEVPTLATAGGALLIIAGAYIASRRSA